MAPVSQRIGNIEGRLDRLDAKVDALGSEMRSLNADTVRQVRESEATLRQEMRAGDEETRRQMRDGDEETRRLMRLLHEDVIDRIKTLGDALLPTDVLTPQRVFALMLLAVPLAACTGNTIAYPTEMEMTTWSVVGVDPKTGDVGVAVASCVPSYGDAVAALVPGKGAAATQAGFDVKNRNKVFEAIKQGLTAEEVIAQVTDPKWDSQTDRRQYGVLTMHNGFVRAAGFTTPTRQGTTAGEDGVARFAGVMADPSRGVSAQGNTLASSEVVQRPLDAYRWEDPAGFNTLPDRLIRALEAGSIAGGDVRCNQGSVRQTTSMAAILVARGSDPPYATENIGMTDAGTDKAPWLNLSVRVERGAENPLLELRRQYDRWRRTQPK